ncbi:hypothetical protein Pint_12740 [Pistacia integerrima]|uniref:Uncharacterized protein n=1 Tax=Pistacia integerrima TaxID=434235 RepID=A0ACC0Y936_9ROSI|nr:hypothetical protein Pint_12740 [Pistacia integerrima]
MLTESICMGYLTMDVTLLRKLFGMLPEMQTISRKLYSRILPDCEVVLRAAAVKQG